MSNPRYIQSSSRNLNQRIAARQAVIARKIKRRKRARTAGILASLMLLLLIAGLFFFWPGLILK